MRNTEQRLLAVQERTKKLEYAKRVRKNKFIGFSTVAACLAVVIAMSFSMPGLVGRLTATQFLSTSGVASIFSSSNAIGYVLIGLLAFLLGVCVTILCVTLVRRTKGDSHND